MLQSAVKWCLVILILLASTPGWCNSHGYQLPVGVISGPEDHSMLSSLSFWSLSNNFTSSLVVPTVEKVQWWDSLQVSRAVCRILGRNIHALVSFVPPRVYPILSSYSNSFKVPLISTRAPEGFMTSTFDISLIPDTSPAVADLIKLYKWDSFVFIYDSNDGPEKLQRIMQSSDTSVVVQAMWRVSNGEEAVNYLQMMLNENDSKLCCVIATTTADVANEMIKSFHLKGGGAKEMIHFILTDSSRPSNQHFPYSTSVVTKLQLVKWPETTIREFGEKWMRNLHHYQRYRETPEIFSDSALLSYDAMNVLLQSFERFVKEQPSAVRFNNSTSLSCLENSSRQGWKYGTTAADYIKKNVFQHGASGNIQFDERGRRVRFSLDIIEMTPSATTKIGTWSDGSGLQLQQNPTNLQPQNDAIGDEVPRRNIRKKLIVTTIEAPPSLKFNEELGSGNARFEGYIKDVVDELSNLLNFDYEMRLVKDGKYGFIDGEQWVGMIGEIIREEADLAVALLTITPLREEVVDFSKPFLTFGLNILMKKPSLPSNGDTLSPFYFLQAFPYDVWLCLVAIYVCFGVVSYLVSNFTAGPDRIRSVDTKESDNFSLCSSFWFALGSFTLRGTGIYPSSVSHRTITAIWWFFSLVAIILYTASLTSLLIRAKSSTQQTMPLVDATSLLKISLEKGFPSVGIVAGGSTDSFFKNAKSGLYKEYGNYLESTPYVKAKSNSEGIDRVRSSNGAYAFIMESTFSDFVNNREPCDTVVLPGFLHNKGFGIAMKKGSPLREDIDHGLLELMETGTLLNLYEKWWNKHSICKNPPSQNMASFYRSSLSLPEASGAFYLLIIGVAVSLIAAVAEYYIRSKRLSVDK